MPETSLAIDVLQRVALEYRDRWGWSVVPVAGKRAVIPWRSFQQRLPTDAELREGFSRAGVTGVAVVGGMVSGGLAIRDYDNDPAYERWAGDWPDLAGTLPTAKTRRGYHVYARLPDLAGSMRLVDGELRGHGAYCVAPPSLHADGGRYEWVIPPAETIPLVDSAVFGVVPPDPPLLPCTPSTSLHALQTVDDAIRATLPTGYGQRNRLLFELARRLKPLGLGWDRLRDVVLEWHRRALPNIRTQPFAESWLDFRVAYARVRIPAGAVLAKVAASLPADLPDEDRLVVLCERLQSLRPGRPFALGVRAAGAALGIPPVSAWRLIQALLADGRLVLVTPGDYQAKRAAEYVWGGQAQ